MKKLLVVHTNYRIIGGEDIAVKNEIKILEKHYDLRTLYFSNENVNIIDDFLTFFTGKNRRSKKILEKIIDEFQPDLVYVHNTWYKASLAIFSVLKKKNIKTLLKIHNFRYNCTKYFSASKHLGNQNECMGCGFSKSKNKFFNKYFGESYLKSFFVIIYGKKYLKIIQDEVFNVVLLTDFHKNFMYENKIRTKNISVIPNVLNVNDTHNVAEKGKYIIYAGRMSVEKGVDLLIKAFLDCELKDISLKLVGVGPIYNSLKTKYQSDNIIFLGEKSNQDVLEMINKSLAVVSATRLLEGQPTLLSEASFLGVPAIFPSNGGIEEFFPKNYELSFENNNNKDLQKKLMVINDPKLLKEIGSENKEYITEKLNEKIFLENFESVSK